MSNDDIINKVKQQSENLEIPDSLRPEQIKIRLDEELIKKASKKKNLWKYNSSLAIAVAALFIVVVLPRFIPLMESGLETNIESPISENTLIPVAEEKPPIPVASSYRSLYKALSAYQKHINKQNITNYRLYDGALTEDAQYAGEAMKELPVADLASRGDSNDFSQTNIQVQGVDEGDIVKTDGNYIYVLDTDMQFLQILKADGETITPVSKINFEQPQSENKVSYQNYSEFYLEQDRLVLISSLNTMDTIYETSGTPYARKDFGYTSASTLISIYDISDRSQPELINTLHQDGSYSSSRNVNSILYTFSYFNAIIDEKNDDPELYIPCTDDVTIPENCIYIPKHINSTGYLVITAININEPDSFENELAIITNPYDFYVSSENIYIANTTNSGDSETEIMKFSYQDGAITPIATNVIPGLTNNSFSFDEYNGYLRVVSTVYPSYKKESIISWLTDYSSSAEEPVSDQTQSNSLYVLDEKLNIVGSIENLAPDEQIYSARFFGDTGYFVTFKRVDPLFSVDLSDPENPVILGELKISGFSSYLHFYSENLLLGIGYEADIETGRTTGIKLSMFDISDPADVKEVDKLVIPEAYYTPAIDNHKTVLINPTKNILGLLLDNEKQRKSDYQYYMDYRTFSYNEESGFKQEISCILGENYYADSRGLYIGDYLYVVEGSSHITIYNLTDNTLAAEWNN